MTRQQNPGERLDEIMWKLHTRPRYDPLMCSPQRNLELIRRVRRAYTAYKKLHGPIRLFKSKKE